MAEHEQLRDLIPAYALGALDEADALAVEEHLDGGCAECERELFAASRDLEAMAETVPPVQPSEMARARFERALGERASGAATAWWQRAAMLAVGLLLAWSVWTQIELRGEIERQAAARAEADQQLAAVRRELDQTRDHLSRVSLANRIIGSPRGRSVVLAGLEPSPEASAQTFVDPAQGRAVFYASNLPAIEPGQTYQLWFIADGTPVSGGTFDVDAEGSAMHLVDGVADIETIQLWAVTIEPAGGVPQPTGTMVLKG